MEIILCSMMIKAPPTPSLKPWSTKVGHQVLEQPVIKTGACITQTPLLIFYLLFCAKNLVSLVFF
jgi:hypothetical protein